MNKLQTLRLYEYFLPKHYDITLRVDGDKRTFDGEVIITGHKAFSRHPILVHTKKLRIASVTIDGQLISTKPHAHDALELCADLPKGDYTVRIAFSGTIDDGLHGLYPCYYEHRGVKKELFATQFESHHAREVFPCVDEPEAKATFTLTLRTAPGLAVLSNTPIKHQTEAKQETITSFATTPRMSTYLLAFVIGEFHATSGVSKNGTKVSVYSTLSQAKSSHNFALQEAIAHLDFFEDYFGVKFPLEKCDHVALPDFSAIAMENWGLITYREGFLTVHNSISISQKQYISSVIAHELAHQWFGNLVTMKWWDDLWLNESFATLMQYIALDATHPDWRIWEDYDDAETLLALSRDQFASVQPVAYSVKSPELIGAVFDKAILYAKGSRLLRMVMEHVGQSDFRQSLHEYFKAFGYSNTDGKDLWRTLSQVSGKRVEQFMDTWLSQAGFPVVNVVSKSNTYQLTQHRFALGGSVSDTLWPIPLNARHHSMPSLLHERSSEAVRASSPQLNRDNINHFITAYDDTSFTYMLDALKQHQLSPVERGALLYETCLLTQAGSYPPERLMTLLQHYRSEQSSVVWNIMASVCQSLRLITGENQHEAPLNTYVLQLTQIAYDKYGMGPHRRDSLNDAKIRARVCELRIIARDAALIDRLAAQSTDDGDLQQAMFLAITAQNNPQHVSVMVDEHTSTHDSHLRNTMARALAASTDKHRLLHMLTWFDNSELIKPQDLPWWYGHMMQNPQAREMTWNWLIEHWQWLEETFSGDHTIDKFITLTARFMSTQDWLQRYNEFFDDHITNATRRVIAMGRDEITSRVEWGQRDSKIILDYITDLAKGIK